jgi:hypothetical protein
MREDNGSQEFRIKDGVFLCGYHAKKDSYSILLTGDDGFSIDDLSKTQMEQLLENLVWIMIGKNRQKIKDLEQKNNTNEHLGNFIFEDVDLDGEGL